MSCARTRTSVGPPRWTWPSTCSTACWTWDARPTSASPDPKRGWGQCARIPDPCNTATTGGKMRLLGITKRGNTYLRTLLIHGARAALPSLSASQSRMGEWLRGLIGRAHKNKVIVALAGKLARIAWAVLRSGETYVKEGRPV